MQVMTCSAIDSVAGFSIFFKCEQFQKGCVALKQLLDEQ